jgi:transposase InsO family protein
MFLGTVPAQHLLAKLAGLAFFRRLPFHGRLRDEFLEREEFETVEDARAKASWYRREYNSVRPHSALGYATAKEFSAACDVKRKEPGKG